MGNPLANDPRFLQHMKQFTYAPVRGPAPSPASAEAARKLAAAVAATPHAPSSILSVAHNVAAGTNVTPYRPSPPAHGAYAAPPAARVSSNAKAPWMAWASMPGMTVEKAIKEGRVTSTGLRPPAEPKAPPKPVTPYMRYTKAVWDQVKAQHPEAGFLDVGRKIGMLWSNLSAGAKEKYETEWKTEMKKWEADVRAFNNSAGYKRYLQEKEAYEADVARDIANAQAYGAHNAFELPFGTPAGLPRGRPTLPTPAVPQVAHMPEAPEGDEGWFSERHTAALRYKRNHAFVAELLEGPVPDLDLEEVSQAEVDERKRNIRRKLDDATAETRALRAGCQRQLDAIGRDIEAFSAKMRAASRCTTREELERLAAAEGLAPSSLEARLPVRQLLGDAAESAAMEWQASSLLDLSGDYTNPVAPPPAESAAAVPPTDAQASEAERGAAEGALQEQAGAQAQAAVDDQQRGAEDEGDESAAGAENPADDSEVTISDAEQGDAEAGDESAGGDASMGGGNDDSDGEEEGDENDESDA